MKMSTSNHNFKNQAYTIIKERLINCIYEPGSFLNEAQLAADLGCSRTPVREAISRLEFDNLVTVVPKKGIHVSDISLTDVQQIFQARLEIEPVALKMAAHNLPQAELLSFRDKFSESLPDIRDSYRLDTAMHLFIIEHCGNRYFIIGYILSLILYTVTVWFSLSVWILTGPYPINFMRICPCCPIPFHCSRDISLISMRYPQSTRESGRIPL